MSAEYLQNARYGHQQLAPWAIHSLLIGLGSRRRYRGPSCTAEYVQSVGRMIYDEPGASKGNLWPAVFGR